MADQTKTLKAQDTAAAAVAPVTTAPLVIDKIIVTVEAAAEKGFDVSLGAIGGTIGFIFASSQKTASEEQDTIHTSTDKKDSAEPAAAAGGAGKGVKGGKKDRSGQGTVDQLQGVNQHVTNTNKGQYGASSKKSQQNIDHRDR